MLLLALLAAISPYIYIAQFAQPVADDYCFSNLIAANSFTDNYLGLFMGMGGRYATNALILLNPIAFSYTELYTLIPIFQIALTIFSVYYFFRALSEYALSRIDSMNISLFFVLIYLNQIPTLAEGFYFFTAAVNYQTGISFCLLYLGLLIDYYKMKYLFHKGFHLLLLLVILILTLGFSEVVTFLLIIIHGMILYLSLHQNKKLAGSWYLILATCLSFSLLMLLAPGNSFRTAAYPDNHNFFHSLIQSLLQIARFGFDWISSLPLLFSTFLFVRILSANKKSFSILKNDLLLNPWLVAFFHFIILFVCIFPPYWATNILGQHRTMLLAFSLCCTGL